MVKGCYFLFSRATSTSHKNSKGYIAEAVITPDNKGKGQLCICNVKLELLNL